MTDVSLANALEQTACAIWPRRSQQEALFDLGWRKAWTEVDRTAAVASAACWIAAELALSLPQDGDSAPLVQEADSVAIARLQALATLLPKVEVQAGIADWICRLAPAVGAGPKTLANSLTDGLGADRRDHRWLRAISRIVGGRGSPNAWAYHRRSPADVAGELARAAGEHCYDTGDALLILSLLALWQRRRPAEQARGNKGKVSARRLATKPIAVLAGALVEPKQIAPLLKLCDSIAPTAPSAAHALAVLVVECALTEAHLAPHADRNRQRRAGHARSSGDQWLFPVEPWLQGANSVLDAEETATLAFRIAAMRAWRDRGPAAEPEPAAVRLPYVVASMALSLARTGDKSDLANLDLSQPGLMMLAPQIRSRIAKEPQ